MSKFELRPPQQACCSAVYRDLRGGDIDSTLAVVATGVGKTIIAAGLASRWMNENERVLFLAHRDELIKQAASKMYEARGLVAQTEKADQYAIIGHNLVTGSVQSLQGDRLLRWPKDAFTKIFIDEAHRSTAQTYRNVFDHFGSAQRIGLTATAFRQKGNLSDIYDHISFQYGLKEAVRDGYLSRLSAQTIPLEIDIGELSSRGGDFSVDELEQKIDPYIQKIAEAVKERASDRKIILFAPTCATSRKCKEIFQSLGFEAFYAGGDDRSEIADFERAGAGSIMCNSMLLTEGYDHPQIDCVIVLRLTKSTGLYCQMVGRGTRLFIGKTDCLVLDFLWNSVNHNICKPACLVAEDDEEEQEMGNILDKSGAPMDLLGEVTDEAVQNIRCERERKLAESLRNFTGREGNKFDPVLESLAVYDSRIANWRAETNWEKSDMSNTQERFLKDSGFDPTGWCKGYAATVISDVSARNSAGLCSPRQMRSLIKNGHANAATFTKQQASEAMDKLQKKWKKAKRWKNIKEMHNEK